MEQVNVAAAITVNRIVKSRSPASQSFLSLAHKELTALVVDEEVEVVKDIEPQQDLSSVPSRVALARSSGSSALSEKLCVQVQTR